MKTPARRLCRTIAWTLVVLAMLAAPGLAVAERPGEPGRTIEAPGAKGKGVGFVLLMSLQRA